MSDCSRLLIGDLIVEIRQLINSARRQAFNNINSLQVLTNFEIGKRIVEQEQQGAERSEYGKRVISALSEQLSAEFGRGFSARNLRNMRQFYFMYKDRLTEIWQKPSAKSQELLSWSHYVYLMGTKQTIQLVIV